MTTQQPPSAGHGPAASGGGNLSRRQLLAGSGLAAATLVATAGASPLEAAAAGTAAPVASPTVSFHGPHQAGIATPAQERLAFAAFDLTAGDVFSVAELLTTWSAAAERMTSGAALVGPDGPNAPPADSGEALGLPPSRLTLTLGFGASLFDRRFGLGKRRPAALVELPPFAGDALDPARSGGDLCIQACADDPRVAFHAVRNLTRLALGVTTLRYLQLGFAPTSSGGTAGASPRNLLGFRDGTKNLAIDRPDVLDAEVWVPSDADQRWMAGGTFLVARRIRTHLEAWDRTTLGSQERVIGRAKRTGAPLGGVHEHDPVDLSATDGAGAPVIPFDAHIRAASPVTNHGASILRRGYSFFDGVDPASGELDAGLFFICFQRDPRRQFIPIQQRLAGQDALGRYVVHTGSAIFACPPGPTPLAPWGSGLL